MLTITCAFRFICCAPTAGTYRNRCPSLVDHILPPLPFASHHCQEFTTAILAALARTSSRSTPLPGFTVTGCRRFPAWSIWMRWGQLHRLTIDKLSEPLPHAPKPLQNPCLNSSRSSKPLRQSFGHALGNLEILLIVELAINRPYWTHKLDNNTSFQF